MTPSEIRFVNVYRVRGHAEMLFRLLKERPSYMNISHGSMPSLQQHGCFVRSKPYREWNFVQYKGEIIGSLYLSKLNEIGIFLFKKFRGQEAPVLRRFVAKNRAKRLLANVSPKNNMYRHTFQRLGFRLIQHSYCLEPA